MAIEKEIKLKIDLDIAKNILNNPLFKIEKATFQKTIHGGIFEREEYESNVGYVSVLNEIFEELGFTKSWIMEKFRIQGTYNGLTLCLDEVCFGIFLEIEGEESEIVAVLNDFSLDFDERITVSYWELWEEYKKKKGFDDSLRDILFGDKEISLKDLVKEM